MPTAIDFQTILPFALDIALKSVVLLGVAALVQLGLRRTPAAVRHAVWFLAMVATLGLPALTLLLPALTLPLPNWSAIVPTETTIAPAAPAPVDPSSAAPAAFSAVERAEDAKAIAPIEQATSIQPATDAPTAPAAIIATPQPATPMDREITAPALPWTTLVAIAWAVGCAALLAFLALGVIRRRQWTHNARVLRAEDDQALLQDLADQLSIRRPIALLESEATAMPMTWGHNLPVVMLPIEARDWPRARRRDVLLHELAHIARGDHLSQRLSQLVCCLYWFNPLAWYAHSRMCSEQERACDDLVLRQGTRPSEYAEHLLAVASGLRLGRSSSWATVPMARPSQLSARILAVLDERLGRRAIGRKGWSWAAGLVALVVVPLAAIQPQAGAAVQSALTPALSALTPQIEIHPSRDLSITGTPTAATTEPTDPVAALPTAAELPLDLPSAPSAPIASVIEPVAPIESVELVAPVEPIEPVAPVESIQIALADIGRTDQSDEEQSYKISIGSNDALRAQAWGDITFLDDESGIRSMAPESFLVIEQKKGRVFSNTIRLEVEPDEQGRPVYRWSDDHGARPFGNNGHEWLKGHLRTLFRGSTFYADERVARLLRRGGPDALFAELDHLQYGSVRLAYCNALLTPEFLRSEKKAVRLLRAARKIDSSSQLSHFLVGFAGTYPADKALPDAFADAAGEISSDSNQSQALVAALQRPKLSDDETVHLLDATKSIGSDSNQSQVLITAISRDGLSKRVSNKIMEVARTISSDSNRSEVLKRLSQTRGQVSTKDFIGTMEGIGSPSNKSDVVATALRRFRDDPEALDQLLREAGEQIDSDSNLSHVLADFAQWYPQDRPLPAGFAAASLGIESSSNRAHALAVALARKGLSAKNVEGLLAAAGDIDSDSNKSHVLAGYAQSGAALSPGFIESTRRIDSSSNRAHVLITALAKPRLDGAILDGLMRSTAEISSSANKSEVLKTLVQQRDKPIPASFYRATGSVSSNANFLSVYALLVARRPLDDATIGAILESIATSRERIDENDRVTARRYSDFLISLARKHAIKGNLQDSYRRATEVIGVERERERALDVL